MKGLQNRTEFRTFYDSIQRETFRRLAEIEQEDADRCANCGGEDCICCEYYIDRQSWVSPEELFEFGDPMYDNFVMGDEDEYEDSDGI